MSAMGVFRFAGVLPDGARLPSPSTRSGFLRAVLSRGGALANGSRELPTSHYWLRGNSFTRASERLVFLTNWRIKGSAEEVYTILTDIPAYLRWWPEVYLAATPLTPGKGWIGQSYRLLTRGKLPYRLRWDAWIVETRRPYGFTVEAAGDFVGRGVWTFTEHANDLKISL